MDKPYAAAGLPPPKIPEMDLNYHRDLLTQPLRTDLAPLDVVMPNGPSFTIEGNLIKWQKWHIRISFNYREGLVLHNVGCAVYHSARGGLCFTPFLGVTVPCSLPIIGHNLHVSLQETRHSCKMVI